MLTCKQCDHEWYPRGPKAPDSCPKCGSARWDYVHPSECPICKECPKHGAPPPPLRPKICNCEGGTHIPRNPICKAVYANDDDYMMGCLTYEIPPPPAPPAPAAPPQPTPTPRPASVVKQATCLKCDFVWTPRVEAPKQCPRCKARLDLPKANAAIIIIDRTARIAASAGPVTVPVDLNPMYTWPVYDWEGNYVRAVPNSLVTRAGYDRSTHYPVFDGALGLYGWTAREPNT